MSRPSRPRLNVRLSPEQIIADREQYGDMAGDGLGIDYRLPLPPWDSSALEFMSDNLATLRVDPTHSNYAQMEISIVRAIAGVDTNYEIHSHYVGVTFDKLLGDCSADTLESKFNEIIRMKKTAEEPPHRNFLAYRAYCDFLLEFGFEPTRQKLAKFIRENLVKYPVGLREPTTGKEWWEMFFEAGLVRLEE